MRAAYSVLLLGAVAACAPALPDSGAGFGAPEPAAGAAPAPPLIPPAAISDETRPLPADAAAVAAVPEPGAAPRPAAGSDDIAAEAAAALVAATPDAEAPHPAPVVVLNNPGISDENDFEAVSERETIESDAERIARNRALYQVVAPTELPKRTGGRQPNIVSYALETRHPVGTRLYSRSGLNLAARSARNCAGFASADLAQIAFLARGGPERDRQALDPDGDGYACTWDPTPFRQALQN